jgi:hypothetical protein
MSHETCLFFMQCICYSNWGEKIPRQFCDVESSTKSCEALAEPGTICKSSMYDEKACETNCRCFTETSLATNCNRLLPEEEKCEGESSKNTECKYLYNKYGCDGDCVCNKRMRCKPVLKLKLFQRTGIK